MTQFIVSGSILFLPPYTQGEKKSIWSELESKPGPLASQATALTTRPRLLGQVQQYLNITSISTQIICAAGFEAGTSIRDRQDNCQGISHSQQRIFARLTIGSHFKKFIPNYAAPEKI